MDIIGAAFTAIDIIYHPLQNYKKFPNVTYVKDFFVGEDVYRSFDIAYDPSRMAEEKLPLLVNIHGGGFVKGDKKHRRSLSCWFADKGYFVLNVNYRLAPANPFPSALQDIFASVAEFEKHAEEFNVDLERVVFSGDSAGAYYAAACYAALKDDRLYSGLELPAVHVTARGLVAFSGLYDARRAFGGKYPFGLGLKLGSQFLGYRLTAGLKELGENKFGEYISPSDFINDSWDKVFISSANHDIFLKGQGEAMLESLTAAGVPYEADMAAELTSNHCYSLLFYKKSASRCMNMVADYLEEIKK